MKGQVLSPSDFRNLSGKWPELPSRPETEVEANIAWLEIPFLLPLRHILSQTEWVEKTERNKKR
jgi:hypothetical protein